MKTMQKLVSILTVLALVFTLCLGVFAAGNENPHTITVTNPDAQEAHQYQAYQVFVGNYSPEDVLTDVAWGNGVDGDALLQDLVNNVPDFAQCTEPIDVAKVLEAHYNDNDFLRLFCSYVNKHLAAPVNQTPATATAAEPAVIDVVGDGYYFVKDVTPELTLDTYSDYMIFVEGDVTIEAKDTTGVTSEKKVWDINDSNLEEAEDWQDSGDYDIGDPVPFRLTGTVAADLDKYETYKVIFHDVESAGLTFQPDSVKVYVGETLITEGYTVVTDPEDDCSFEIVFPNVKTIDAIQGGSEITIYYESILNENAVIGNPNKPDDNYGNPNKMQMEYSNNPTCSAEGDENNTGFTPWDEVIVYTYQVEINKVDQDGNPLHGAEFELYKWYLNEDVDPDTFTPDMVGNEAYGHWVLVENGQSDCTCNNGETGKGQIIKVNGKLATPMTFDGVDYVKIRDHADPASPDIDMYLKVADIERFENFFPVGIPYYVMGENGVPVPNPTDFSYTVRNIEREAIGEPCHYWWAGVDDGWYQLVETQKPKPEYDDLDPIVFEIIANHTVEEPVVLDPVYGYVDGEPFFRPLDENIGIIHANIENHSGSHLPSTGGVGTVLFYVLGGLLVLGAGVLLVVKKFSDAN